ncbi:MAG: hypothetical protein NTW72_11735 [Gemmatimonadetes bacterium]|nr:hypothetical protein [Gemmatimonadota bacterium]
MDDLDKTVLKRTNDPVRPLLKLWTLPRLARMGSVSELTSKVGLSQHRDSNRQKNKTF